ncbi:rhodanese-like domain-containing protein [Geitlerinema sp. PCC 9228]|jgi:rhodanese-related sulfurtransferase|uniref:rhodanese-like domain-containing protein n=1 Tax=Geitlerinema sp. PCC 9228 TaxID=111611 RepID=UPI0008F9A569|nr:rhodanese-like domain-containing protein [Geitlerinema sp. PCC 9228]
MNLFDNLIPKPVVVKSQSRAYELKDRLDWGEPALTIVDARDRESFNQGHIMGAISMPASELIPRANANLETNRDIYIYGETDEETEAVAAQLRSAGYENVSELLGGLAAWKAAGYPVESVSSAAA